MTEFNRCPFCIDDSNRPTELVHFAEDSTQRKPCQHKQIIYHPAYLCLHHYQACKVIAFDILGCKK